ncbi:RHS repeat domain-containing protein [Paenibacillus sp. KN14-4R]|uniref:RHS repeat domain-containing protein n=1 Tax=Paenibacillus sp. KN14-4R TaxID=3445773 RepID=UPI003FA10D01
MLRERRIDIPKSIVSYTERSGSKSDEKRQTTFYNDYGQVDTHYQRVNADTTTAKIVYTYDDQHNLKSKSEDLNRDGKKRVTEYTYTAQKDVMGITVSEQNTQGTTMLSEVAFISDEYGNPTRKTTTSDGGKIFEDYEYDATYHALMTKQTNDMMDPTFKSEKVYRYMDYDRSTGLLNWVKDGNGQTTNYTYDKLGRLTKVTNPDKSTSTAAYDDVNNKIIYTDETNVQTTHTFNVYGWKRQVYGDNNGKMDYIYDNSGRVVREEDAVGNLTHHFYDESNRLVQTTYPTQDNMIIAYNSIANTRTIRATDSRLFKETYGLQGEVLRSQEFWGNSGEKQKLPTKISYDFEGHMLESREHYAFVEESYNKTTKEYDALGRLTAITTPNNEKTAYKYTKTNLLKQVTYPDGNFIEKVYDQSGNLLIEKDENKNQTLHAYDKEGNEKTLIDRKGNTFTYEYDSRNRLKKKTATNREIGLYDPEITFDYDLAGRMTTMNDYTGTTKYQYDYAATNQAKLGLLKSITYPDGKQLSYEYDEAGQVTSMTDPFGKVTNYAYQAGRLDKVGQDLTKPDASYTYKAGNLDRIDLNTGKIVTNHIYTEGMLSDVTHKTDVGQSLGSYGYEYDDYANITNLKENNQVTSTLTYDPLHRVQTNSMFKETYQYNNRGNRETLQSDQLPQVPLNQYKYDSRDQLIEVKVPAKNADKAKLVEYVYNGNGLMVKRTEVNQDDYGARKVSRYYYDADSNIIAEEKTEGDTTSQYSYIRSRGQLVAKVDQAGSKQYYLHNGHGDVVSITDDQGNKLAEYKYDIWGKILPAEGNNLANKVDNIFLYSGEYYDETTELQYLRARWYDPSVGRFIQEDTYDGQIDKPQSLNLYTYVENNPLIKKDPTGHMVLDSDDDGSNYSFYNFDDRLTWKDVGKKLFQMGTEVALDGIRTLNDPNAGVLDKTLAVAGYIPIFRWTGDLGKFALKGTGKIDYKEVFFKKHPELEKEVVVHHAIEQQVLRKPEYKGLFTEAEMHGYNNLRGIPKEINSDIHLSKIRK